jgi:hypothetical protein
VIRFLLDRPKQPGPTRFYYLPRLGFWGRLWHLLRGRQYLLLCDACETMQQWYRYFSPDEPVLAVTPCGLVRPFATVDEVDLGVFGLLLDDDRVLDDDGTIHPTIEAFQIAWGRHLIKNVGWSPEAAARAVNVPVIRLVNNRERKD